MKINNNEIAIKDYRTLKYGVEIDVEIKTIKQRGFALMKIWGPYDDKTKKKCTVMIAKNINSDEKFAKIFSRTVVKPLIDSHIKGENWNEMITNVLQNNDKTNCRKCKKPVNKSYLKTHMLRQHPECNLCKESFLIKSDLKDHMVNIHSNASIKVVKEVIEDNTQTLETKSLKCDNCDFTAYSDRYLWLHKEKHHIEDPTDYEMIGSKRDLTLVKTSSI